MPGSKYYWDSRTGRYHNAKSKRMVKRVEVLKELDKEEAIARTKLKKLAGKLVNEKITLAQFEAEFTGVLKRSHIRMGLLGSGGKNHSTQQVYGGIGRRLRDQYQYLDGFVNAIAKGELSKKQIVARAAMYSGSSRISFSQSEVISRKENGIRFAKRLLDSTADHCSPCILHERKEWTPINEIVPIGVRCTCHQSCKCRLIFASTQLGSGTTLLANAIRRS